MKLDVKARNTFFGASPPSLEHRLEVVRRLPALVSQAQDLAQHVGHHPLAEIQPQPVQLPGSSKQRRHRRGYLTGIGRRQTNHTGQLLQVPRQIRHLCGQLHLFFPRELVERALPQTAKGTDAQLLEAPNGLLRRSRQAIDAGPRPPVRQVHPWGEFVLKRLAHRHQRRRVRPHRRQEVRLARLGDDPMKDGAAQFLWQREKREHLRGRRAGVVRWPVRGLEHARERPLGHGQADPVDAQQAQEHVLQFRFDGGGTGTAQTVQQSQLVAAWQSAGPLQAVPHHALGRLGSGVLEDPG